MMASSSVERIVLVWPDSGSVPYIVENPYHGPCQKSTLCTGTAVVYQYISVVSVYKRPLRYIKPSVRDIALDQVYSPSYYFVPRVLRLFSNLFSARISYYRTPMYTRYVCTMIDFGL